MKEQTMQIAKKLAGIIKSKIKDQSLALVGGIDSKDIVYAVLCSELPSVLNEAYLAGYKDAVENDVVVATQVIDSMRAVSTLKKEVY